MNTGKPRSLFSSSARKHDTVPFEKQFVTGSDQVRRGYFARWLEITKFSNHNYKYSLKRTFQISPQSNGYFVKKQVKYREPIILIRLS